MKTFNGFLHPKRKENLKFVLSDAFVDEDGTPLEWEMRQLSAKEGMELTKNLTSTETSEIWAHYVANALVVPNLRDAEFLEDLSKREGRKILDPLDALYCLVTDGELAKLMELYNEHNSVYSGFQKAVQEAKN